MFVSQSTLVRIFNVTYGRHNLTPDGGLKRLRIYGHPLLPSTSLTAPAVLQLPALPLTPETFAPYGEVVQGFSLPTSAPKGKSVTVANQGTAAKYHRMAHIGNTYEPGSLVRGGPYAGVTRAESKLDISKGAKVVVETLERWVALHDYVAQILTADTATPTRSSSPCPRAQHPASSHLAQAAPTSLSLRSTAQTTSQT